MKYNDADYISYLYKNRFSAGKSREIVWKVLCKFFQKYIDENCTVLDMAAGYCEFINNIKAKNKIVVDVNSDTRKYANPEVKVIITKNSGRIPEIRPSSVDVVFQSNFFEHLSRPKIFSTIAEIHRMLKPRSLFILLNPNVRYCYRDYWMFFDHFTPLDDRAMTELLETSGFEIVELRPRFLPYIMKSKLSKSGVFIEIYLRIKFLQKIFGKQMLIVARKL